jgi:hypothetical protein
MYQQISGINLITYDTFVHNLLNMH